MSVPEPMGGTAEADRARYAVARQEAIYDGADAPVWRKAIYDLLHEGWELACIGGLPFLRDMAGRAGLGPGARALELGCGAGAACRYLARLTGCDVVGIERNAAQLARAEARRGDAPEAARLRFRAGDVADAPPDEAPVDCVFLLDTLSLLPDPLPALRAARALVRPGGGLFVADLGATPLTAPDVLAAAHAEDGFSSLLDCARFRDLLAAAGFAESAARDRTDQAADGFGRVLAWLDGPGTADPEIAPEAREAWRETTAFYLRAFETRQLEYRWWSARAA
ncbi:class I SAM-dependent methyltransferase [Salinarimonas sp.]|uniref:class I SAM-dependent methyltransferase n=1 Tax=Salinarimonas sp. TaxID=2766526 RepID=UPI0032D8C0B0